MVLFLIVHMAAISFIYTPKTENGQFSKHSKDLPTGTLITILKQAGIDKSEL
jgi:hypothetical protein